MMRRGEEKESIAILLLNVILYSLAIISIVIDVSYGFYKAFNKDYITGTYYVGDQSGLTIKEESDLTETEKSRSFLEANYYSNENGNGNVLLELKFNYFTDFTISEESERSSGMQYFGKNLPTYNENVVRNEASRTSYTSQFYDYDGTDGIYYKPSVGLSNKWNIDGNKFVGWDWDVIDESEVVASVGTYLNASAKLIIKIGDKPYAIQLTGYTTKPGWLFGWWTDYYYYTYDTFFQAVMTAVKTNSRNYSNGNYYITLKISDFFSFYRFNEKTGKFESEAMKADEINTFGTLKFHYDKNGANTSSQSIFGTIYGNSRFGEENVKYTVAAPVRVLSSNDFTYRYSELANGYLLSLNGAAISEKSIETDVIIDVSYINEQLEDGELVGIDYNAFKNVEIRNLTVLNGRIRSYTDLSEIENVEGGITYEN